MNKKELREDIKRKKEALGEKYFEIADEKITDKILNLEEYKVAKRIFIYVNMTKEAKTIDVIRDALDNGKDVFVPKCIDAEEMCAYRIRSLNDLEESSYGILEPKESCNEESKNFDLSIIPCVTCDKNGNRLGHGRGYYDRFLKTSKENTICLCYEKLISEEVQSDENDVKIDCILTEEKEIRI